MRNQNSQNNGIGNQSMVFMLKYSSAIKTKTFITDSLAVSFAFTIKSLFNFQERGR